MSIPPAPNRAPLTIRDGVIDIGVNRTRFISEHDDGLLRSYLLLLRRTRDQRRAASITLRRDDIEVIAKYVDTTAEVVLGRLADLMGSTRTQRAAMLTMFATGAMLIAATGSAAAESPRSAVPEFVDGPAPAVIEVAAPPRASGSESTAPPAVKADADVKDDGEVKDDLEIYDAAARAAVSAAVERQAARVESLPNETGVTDDGSTVAVGPPPVPRPVESLPNETGVTDDGSTVAVGPPPVPPVPVPPSSG